MMVNTAQTLKMFLRIVTSARKKLGALLVICGIVTFGNISILRAELQLESWNEYGYLAEQGAICASFSSLMEAQSVLNPDIGKLWQERRKYAGAVIRKAAEFELKRTPDTDEIDRLVNQYSDWVIESLMSKDATLNQTDLNTQQGIVGQQKMQKLIDSYCRTMFAQGDKQILASNAELAYLLRPAKTPQQKLAPPEKQITLDIGQGASFSLSLPKPSTPPTPAKQALTEPPASPKQGVENNSKPGNIVALLQPANIKPATVVPKPAPTLPPAPTIPVIAAPRQGKLIIQLGSFSQKQNAESIRQKLLSSYPGMLQHIDLNINEHRLTTGSLFYRVETQTLDQKTAQIICDFLWTERLPCLLKSV